MAGWERNLIPRIQEIKENAVNDFNLRIMKPLKNTHMEEQEKEKLMSAVDTCNGEGCKQNAVWTKRQHE